MDIIDEITAYWDRDAATYDDAPGHRPRSPAVRAAWTAALERLLPTPPARVLDCGAGTGFLSLLAARLGHSVTALDVSAEMLDRLSRAATAEGLDIEVVVAPADQPPPGHDVVMERHLLWTLADPGAALQAWRAAVGPAGRLVAVESVWGQADPLEIVRARGRELLRRMRGTPPDHHAEYRPDLRSQLPLGSGSTPSHIVELVEEAGWPRPRLGRLRDVEWSASLELPLPERLLGVAPRYAVVAG
jgi:SAM-dependent methyltransferase